ncbi:hypothetical protein ES703_44423 [subsurface metagenome]
MGGAAYCVATDRIPDLAKAAFYINSGVITARIGDVIYERGVAPRIGKVKAKGGALTEAEKAKMLLAAREAARVKAQGGGQMTAAETQLLLEAARTQGAQGGARQPAGVVAEI